MPVTKPRFELRDEYVQIALGLELPEIELEGVGPEEARLRSEAGRNALLTRKGTEAQPAWFARFEMLMNSGWPWRQATYIAWASMPKKGRQPAGQEELAKQYLNLTSDRAISTWRRKNPAIDSMIAILQSAELWDHRADAFQQLVEGMLKAGGDYKYVKHLEMFMRMSGDDVPLSQLAVVMKRKAAGGPQEINDEDLDDLAAGAKEMEKTARQGRIADDDEDGDE